MDSNAHSVLWGNSSNNSRGDELEEFVFGNNLTTLNVGNTPTFESGVGKSFIDLTMTNINALNRVQNWRVDEEASLSDHRYIKFVYERGLNSDHWFRNVRKTNWRLFQNVLWNRKDPQNSLMTTSDLDEEAKDLTEVIMEAFNGACPARKALKRKPVPWWNDELTQLRKKVRVSYRSYIREGKPVRHLYKTMIQEYKKGIASAKRDSWKNYCSEVSDIKDIGKLVRCISGRKYNEVGLVKDEGGSYAKTPNEALTKMMDCHFPGSVDTDEPALSSGPLPTEIMDIREVEGIVTEQKVVKAFNSFKSFKAPGADGIRPVFLKNLTPNIIGRVADLYRACLRLGYTPKTWREMKVIFIPKPGKVQYDDVKSFRPITLSSFLLKGLERIVLWKLLGEKLSDPLFNQYGFTKNRGTDMALSDVVDEIEKTVLRGKHAIGCSLDIRGAFDFVEFDTIKDGLMVKGINKQVINWYDQLLRNRVITTDLKGCQITRRPTRGTPQGGILSPVVWNVALDLLTRKFVNKPIKP